METVESPTTSDPETSLTPTPPTFVVGIGASAGGLESLEKLFRNLPNDTGMAFVVLQHLSPDFKSMMFELLGRDTSMTIHRAEDDMLVEANSVYLLPPKKEMVIRSGHLLLSEKDRNKGLALPIDLFLESLALDRGPQAIAIILSGSGSDGSRGVVEVARCGGFVISETPETAKFDGMPSSAIGAGVVDEVLAPEQIGGLLERISSEPKMTRKERIAQDELRQDALQGLDAIYHMFRRVHDIDFSVYKNATVLRRIHRRVAMVGADSVDAYAKKLQQEPKELDSLYADLLIGVTQFFRDPETYEALQRTVIPELVVGRNSDRPVRVWVSGCATGEEPYSLAIAFHEAFELADQAVSLKLFATDVHKASIEHAGRGIYRAEVLKGLSRERIEKYFTPRENGCYQVSAAIRKSIVFAPHNVLNDAPFTDLDLVSCRNLLIYFQSVAQTRALSMFHYGLNKNGVLLLGGSETPGELSSEFEVLNERAKIYRKFRNVRLPNEFRTPLNRQSAADLHALPVRMPQLGNRHLSEQHAMHDQLLNRFMPPSLLIDDNRYLVDSFGGAEKFLRLQARQPSLDVLDLMDDSLRATLSGAIGRTLQGNAPVRFANVVLNVGETEQAFNLTVTPLTHPSVAGRHHLISFELLNNRVPMQAVETEELPSELNASRDHIRQLQDDLRYSRENLQATIEELETSNEELQATNEELIASNEELQSTNEELHSVNEELYTVNAEHQSKIDELAELNRDMTHLLENTDVATVFLDQDLRVRRFTSRVNRVFDLLEHDIGRPITSFLPRFKEDHLPQKLRQVIASGQSHESETMADDGTIYLMRILPYRSEDRIQGAVLMLVDVSSLEVLRERLRWMSAIVESTEDAIIGQDLQGIITSWNRGAEQLYGYATEQAIGQHVSMLVPPDRRDEVDEYHSSIKAGERLHTRDTLRIRRDGSEIHVSLTVSPVHDGAHRLMGISKIARDVSDRIAMEEKIQSQVKQREAFLATLSHELRNPLGAALNAIRLIRDVRTDPATRRAATEIVERQITMTKSLLFDLLDVSRISQGKISLKLTRIDLRTLVDSVRETTQSEISRHGQKLVWDVCDQPCWVLGDPTRLIQVQVNLIQNASKYADAGTEIVVRLRHEAAGVVVQVEDSGIGIPPDQLENIFDPFVQLVTSQKQREGGLGVGLTLVRSLIQQHNGQVRAQSVPGQGSVFRVWLPDAVNSAAAEPDLTKNGATAAGGEVNSASSERSAGKNVTTAEPTSKLPASKSALAAMHVRKKNRTIVLVEDIDDSRQMLTSLLELDGHRVFPQSNGEEGVAAILQHRPEVALVDIGLPGIDGFEVARQVRAVVNPATTYLIALTGFGQASDIHAALDAGFDAHLVKPIDPDELSDWIERLGEAKSKV